MYLIACLNGNRTRQEHPHLPCSPRELARAGLEAVQACAHALHVHPRNALGRPSLDAVDIGAALDALRAACPGTPLGVSTTLGIERDPVRRLTLVRGWTVRPDFASVNFWEPGAVELSRTLLTMGVGVEAGLSSAPDARALLQSGLFQGCLRVMLELEEQTDLPEALRVTREMQDVLGEAWPQVPRLLHGVNATAWPLLHTALAWNFQARIGFEDTLLLPGGQLAPSNADQIRAAYAPGEPPWTS
ncbi:3-keto-5-aminohexanoate cleavage protein [Deinococcus peraridilitoris]|uniref:3-keto-5-aminohexanoate cleavage enzyme n=1 Tax=Deinococcus peraridilitoris (strain DSM 19664 / LMG 22246 / CIP 109416 / KR-200) TaxID=937777 RepID=L0A133_DEIPD|nr:3-keto-5-aminohexanoate cleavage protein [Deinococcus peraridilitoris]AFZ66897.1 hypothetical protein Deipe_1348 [Deinococcus peraridilitoris DSM 19664]